MPHTLLLADDSATIRRVIEMTFAGEDVRVATVGDGREAIERIAADPPDIVLADTNMPEKDGYAVSAFVKANRALSHIPVVLLTGAFDPVDGERAREVGCDAVLVKPFEPQVVINRVRELLGVPAGPETGTPESAGPTTPAPRDDAPDRAGADTGQSVAAPASPPSPADRERPLEAQAPAVADGTLGAAGGDGDERGTGPDPAPAASAPAEAPARAAEAGDSTPPVPAVPAVEAPAPPSLADAFASLLAAEQGDLDRARTAYPWPRQAAPVSEDDLIERVAERVVQRLSDDVTGELVSEVVARVAERLVRDQIDRIKPV